MFVKLGDLFVKLGDLFVKLGDLFVKLGDLFDKLGDLFDKLEVGGDGRVRTDDILRAEQVLSQLSYVPKNGLDGWI